MSNAQLQKIFQQRLNKILDDQDKDSPVYSGKLREKGVEYSIILPLLETILNFDPIDDIEYECNSNQVHGQRFDFLLDGCFVVESKSLSNTLAQDEINQLIKYISFNDYINYGFLTNGLRYELFIQRKYIEHIANNGVEIIGAEKDVYNILKISADDSTFYDIIQLFSKQSYNATFESISKYVFKQLEKTKGPDPVIVSDKVLNDKIKKDIRKKLDIKHGHYFKQIKNGEISPGDKLKYSDEYIDFFVTIQPDGTLLMSKGSMKINANRIIEDGTFYPVLENFIKWHDQDRIFKGPKTIFREASGKSKIYNKKWRLMPY